MRYNIDKDRNWLRDFLNIYWLRPENALWRALNCCSLSGLTIEEPSLDLSCGDGVFSFMVNGGDFKTSFDVFYGAGDLDEFYENTDIYDAAPSAYSPEIARRPGTSMTAGTDWKTNLLEKAEKLDFYDELIEHDNNDPLPFEDNRFNTVYSNSAYWVDNIDLHLSEIDRVLADSGRGILQLKTTAIRDFLKTLRAEYGEMLGWELVDLIDRGRSDHYATIHDDGGWTDRLNEAGLRVVERRKTVTWVHTRLWDIGLRPISPHLIRMANSLQEEQRRLIKEDWIDSWERLLQPFWDNEFDLDKPRPAPEIIYVVEPSP